MKNKTLLSTSVLAVMLAGTIVGCQKNSTEAVSNVANQDEKALVAAAGFNSNWFEKTREGKYLVEGDMLLTKAQLEEMAGKGSTHNFIVANEEHYRTYNVVSTPSTGSRVITVRLTDGFPDHYSTALDNSLKRYNSYGLKISFQRVSTGGDIVVTAANLGTSGGGCILGRLLVFQTQWEVRPLVSHLATAVVLLHISILSIKQMRLLHTNRPLHWV
jgi:hypothetical protein